MAKARPSRESGKRHQVWGTRPKPHGVQPTDAR